MLKYIKKFLINSHCLSCGNKDTTAFYYICTNCLPKQNIQIVCPLCHDSWVIDGICQNCNNETPEWNQLYTIFPYKEIIKDLFHYYKFKDSILAEKDIVKLLKPHLDQYADYHFVIAPCNQKTKRRLGFNPVTNIIKQITDNYSEPFINKNKYTSKHLSREQRKNTTSNIIFDPKKLKCNKNLLLVDDIFTTGSTLTNISLLLKQNNITNFDALCFFRS